MSDETRRWRSNSYPQQTCPDHSHEVSPIMASVEETQQPLPKIIRGVTDSTVPPEGRTLIICLDGTGDKFDSDNSNVVNFVACLKKDDPNQLTYYQSGIGTYDGAGMKDGFSASMDMAVGSGLGIHIKDAYRFLMQNYREGDRICLLGFSRGAYTVRCLAGMLHKVGLLPAHNRAQVNFAYNFYKDDSKLGWSMSADFKKTFCTNVEVYFVGVWDCVASVGFIPRTLPFSKTPTNTIHFFRHAMALDEHRAKFKILHFAHQDPAGASRVPTIDFAKLNQQKDPRSPLVRLSEGVKSCFGMPTKQVARKKEWDEMSNASSSSHIRKEKQNELMRKFEAAEHSVHKHIETDVCEVWFAGAHADVGGGAVKNHERHMLSRIPLRWMIRQCFECNTGILFSTAALAEAGIDIPTIYPIYQKTKKPIVGPSPDIVEQYEAGALPPLSRRSTALGVDGRKDEKGVVKLSNGNGHAPNTNGYSTQKERDYYSRVEKSNERGDIYNEREYRRANSPIHVADLLPEQVEDHFDARSPLNDMLALKKGWWILEFWPVKVLVQRKESQTGWEKVVRMNMGRYRAVREVEPKMHWTVQCRMGECGYKVRNRVDSNAVWQIAT